MVEDTAAYDATTKIIKNRPGQGRCCGNCGIRVDGECTLDRAEMERCLLTPGRQYWRLNQGRVVAQCTERPEGVETENEKHDRDGEINKAFNRDQEGMPCDFCSHHVNEEPSFCVTCDPENSNYDPYKFVCECPECGAGKEKNHVVEMNDMVNHPNHYTQHPREVIDIIKDQLIAVYGPDGYRAYCWGNEIKYRMRAGLKGDAAQDIEKAMKYKEFREAIDGH